MAEVARWRELTGALDAAAAADGTGSLSAAVRHGGRTVWTHAAGWADREQGWRADAATVYRVGSISKTVAVTVALRLAERGLLDVDEPVARLVPEIETAVGYAGQPRVITLRDLATHTSGLAREPRIPRLLAGAADRWEETLLGAIPATRFAHPPGVCFDYSNIGAAILGLAVRRAGGMPYPELVAGEICAPLGLTATGFLPPADRERLATGYERLVDGSISTRDAERQHAGRGFRVPGGGLYSTPSEIAAFAAALGPGAEGCAAQRGEPPGDAAAGDPEVGGVLARAVERLRDRRRALPGRDAGARLRPPRRHDRLRRGGAGRSGARSDDLRVQQLPRQRGAGHGKLAGPVAGSLREPPGTPIDLPERTGQGLSLSFIDRERHSRHGPPLDRGRR